MAAVGPPSQGRLPEVLSQLKTLPRELVDQIIDSLTIKTILEAICYEDEVLDHIIYTHRHYRVLGKLERNREAVKILFKTYEILRQSLSFSRRMDRWPECYDDSATANNNAVRRILKMTPATAEVFDYVLLTNLIKCARGLIISATTDIYPGGAPCFSVSVKRLPVLTPAGSATSLHDRAMILLSAHHEHRNLKKLQLDLLADLYARYPDVLRLATDPRGERSRVSVLHLTKRLRQDAQRLQKAVILLRNPWWRVTYAFRSQTLPLVPYNWCLVLFLKKVAAMGISLPFSKAPAPVEEEDYHTVMVMLQRERKLAQTNHPSPNPATEGVTGPTKAESTQQIPNSILRDIKIVLQGIHYVHPRPDPNHENIAVFKRTHHIPAPSKSKDSSQPKNQQKVPEPIFLTSPLWKGKVSHYYFHLPHSWKEFIWLGAFCRVVEWMMGEVGGVVEGGQGHAAVGERLEKVKGLDVAEEIARLEVG